MFFMNSQHRIEELDLEFKHVTAVNNFKSNLFFSKQVIVLILGILKNKLSENRRNQKLVLEEYDEGHFKEILQIKSWKNFDNLFDFLFQYAFSPSNNTNSSSQNYMFLDNKLCTVSAEEFYKYRQIPFLTIIKQCTDPKETIVELGCGWGRNLFFLRGFNFKNKLEGYEFTKNGFESCKEVNEFFNCHIKFGRVDLTKELEIDISGKTVFTQKVLEQLKYDTEKVINNLIKAKPKQVIHIEPTYELYPNNIRGIASRLYIKLSDYQDSLLTTLKSFEKEGKLKILDAHRLKFGAKPIYEDSLIRWKPV